MRVSIGGVLSLAALAGLALPALSQTSGVQTAGSAVAPRKPQPEHYTAELKTMTVKMLADGTTINMESIEAIANDSQGRSMSSTADLWNLKDGKPTTFYFVTDPVAGTQTTWTSPGTKATVTTNRAQRTGHSDCTVFFSTPEGNSMNAPPGSETPETAKKIVGKVSSVVERSSSVSDPLSDLLRVVQDNSTAEDLGTATIQGVEAHGKRFTWTIPAGATGNDKPMVHTQEDWFTTGDNPRELNVRHVNEDPESGKSTTELESLSLEDPDLSVFQPPEGYEIVTEEVHSAPCPKELKQPPQ